MCNDLVDKRFSAEINLLSQFDTPDGDFNLVLETNYILYEMQLIENVRCFPLNTYYFPCLLNLHKNWRKTKLKMRNLKVSLPKN